MIQHFWKNAILAISILVVPPIGLGYAIFFLSELNLVTKAIEGISSWAHEFGALLERKYSSPMTILGVVVFTFFSVIAIYGLATHMKAIRTDNLLQHMFVQLLLTGALCSTIAALSWVVLPLEWLFKTTFSKVIASLIASASVLLARLIAIEFFSAVFPFPPTYLATALTIATIVIAFAFAGFLFLFLAFIFEIGIFVVLLLSDTAASWKVKSILMMATLTGLVGGLILSIVLSEGLRPRGQLFFVKMAETYDFTKNHMCASDEDTTVLFIENMPDRAIAASFPALDVVELRNISSERLNRYMPTGFRTVKCNPIESESRAPSWCSNPTRLGFCE